MRILKEYVKSEYTFGFELEALSRNSADFRLFAEELFGDDNVDVGFDSSVHDIEDCYYCDGNGPQVCRECSGTGITSGACDACDCHSKVECPICGGDKIFKKNVTCAKCYGEGKIGEEKTQCPECNGNGTIIEFNDCSMCDGTGEVDCTICGGTGEIDTTCSACDGTGEVHCEICDGTGTCITMDNGFEMKVGGKTGMPFTIDNIKKTMDLLMHLDDYDVYVNSSCGFHHHLAWPNYNAVDASWVTLFLALNPKVTKNFLKLEVSGISGHSYKMHDDTYANTNYLALIADSIRSTNSIENAMKYITTEKYRVFHIHPQGTLEWRGPRGFLEVGGSKAIQAFYKLLWQFVSMIDRVITMDEMPVDEYFKDEITNPIRKRDIAGLIRGSSLRDYKVKPPLSSRLFDLYVNKLDRGMPIKLFDNESNIVLVGAEIASKVLGTENTRTFVTVTQLTPDEILRLTRQKYPKIAQQIKKYVKRNDMNTRTYLDSKKLDDEKEYFALVRQFDILGIEQP